MGNQSELLKKAEQYVKHLFIEKLDKKRVYHSIKHTQRIVDAVNQITVGNRMTGDGLL